MRASIAFSVVLVLTAGFAGCASKTNEGPAPTTEPTTPIGRDTGVGMSRKIQAYSEPAHYVDPSVQPPEVGDPPARVFRFDPPRILMKYFGNNDTVNFTLRNEDDSTVPPQAQVQHNLVITEFNLRIPLTSPGRENTARANVTGPGQFEYFCDVALPSGQTHKDLGMFGTLVIEAAPPPSANKTV